MDELLHHRATTFVLLGSTVIAFMIVWGGVARPWAYKHTNDDGVLGKVATGILVTTG